MKQSTKDVLCGVAGGICAEVIGLEWFLVVMTLIFLALNVWELCKTEEKGNQ